MEKNPLIHDYCLTVARRCLKAGLHFQSFCSPTKALKVEFISTFRTNERAQHYCAQCDDRFGRRTKRLKVEAGLYVTPRVRDLLNLQTIAKKEMSIKTFGGARYTKSLDLVNLCVKVDSGLHVYINAFVNEISYPLQGQHHNYAKNNYPHLRGLKLADNNPNNMPVDIDILIGSDFYWNFIDARVVKKGRQGEPVAISSKLGFIVSGKIPKKVDETSVNITSTHVLRVASEPISPTQELNKAMNKFWDIESLGINCDEISDSEIPVLEKFESEIKFREGKYEVKFPFKENHEVLRSRYTLIFV